MGIRGFHPTYVIFDEAQELDGGVDVDERTRPMEPGDHDKFAHIVVPASAVTEAYITGSAVTALCGKQFTPTRDPDLFGMCPSCKEILEMARGGGS